MRIVHAGVAICAALLCAARMPAPDQQPEVKSTPNEAPRADGRKPQSDRHGDPLPVGALARLGTTRFRHGHNVKGMAYSADGKFLASAGWDHTVRLWDATTGEEIRSFGDPKTRDDPYHVGRWVFCVAFSPDGKLLAAGYHAQGWPVGSLRIWDVATGKEQLVIEQAHQNGVLAVAFSRDSQSIASAGADGTIRLWDVAKGKPGQVFDGHAGAVSCVAFAAGGKSLASAGADGTVRLWDVTTGKELHQFQGQRAGVGSLAVSADGKALVSAGGDQAIHFWDAATGKELRKWSAEKDVTVISLSADGEFLATAVGDKALQIRDAVTGKVRHALKGPRMTVCYLAFAPDGKTLAAAAENDNSLWLWDPATGKVKGTARAHQDWIGYIAFNDDGKTLTSAGRDRSVRRWELASGNETGWFEGGQVEGRAVALAPDNKTLAIGGADGTVSLRDPNTGRELLPLGKHHGPVMSVAFSADGKSLASGGQDKIARLWELSTGKERCQLAGHFGAVAYVAFSSDGKLVATGGGNNIIRIWDTATGRELSQLTEAGQAPVVSVAFSPDSRLLAGGSTADGSVRVWEVASGKLLHHLRGHAGYVSAVAFSPDGRTLAVGCWRSVRLWEVATGKERGRLEGHLGDVGSISFSPNGKRLASGSSDTTILVWDLPARFGDAHVPTVKLTPAQLKELLAALTGNDSAAAYRAVWTLAAAPAQCVPLLKGDLQPVAPVDAKRLAELITALDDDAFDVREKATIELKKLGEAAEGALRKALKGEPSPEVSQRVRALLEKLTGHTPSAERLRTARSLEVLELAGSPEARQILENLAKGAPGAWLTREAQQAVARLAQQPAGP